MGVQRANSGPLSGGEEGGGGGDMEQLTVAVRVRPLAPAERARGRVAEATDDKMVTLQENDGDKNDVLRQKRRHEKHFVYDLAFGEDSTQKQLYERTTKPLIGDVLQGFNATVFAYGPTGAGKTYTMVGTVEQPGIMVRAMNDLFKYMAEKKNELEFTMTLSYLEIYNENIRDLLKPTSGTLELREDAKKGTIEVAGLSEVSTMNTKEVMKLLTKGNKERTMESTAANSTSSRSHALLMVSVRQQSRVRDIRESVKVGRLYMIDLAGSERAKRTKNQGKRLQEGAHINRSLLALGNCINALAVKGAKYVNYRDSKLTRLLKDALSGNTRTVMIAHISPAMAQREETFNTLVYADRAKNITNKVKRNVLDVTHQVSQYQSIISELKNEISRLKGKMNDGDQAMEPDVISQPRSREQEEELRDLRNELMESFREQMELRKQMMEIDNVLLWLAMEFEKQTNFINEMERKQAINGKPPKDDKAGDKSPDADEDDLNHALDDLRYIQQEEQRYQDIRKNCEADLFEVKETAKSLEETLPDKISTEEQRELLQLLLKTHELEIENIEMRSNQLLKDHELRRRDLMILRFDRQRALCDEIISRQRDVIHDMESGKGGKGGSGNDMPPELQKMYELYTQELNSPSGQRDARFLHGLNEVMRSTSSLSMRSSDDKSRLPPINGSERDGDRLFQHLPRRGSGDVEANRRPQTPLTLRSPSSSLPGSAASPLRLPPIQVTASPNVRPMSAEQGGKGGATANGRESLKHWGSQGDLELSSMSRRSSLLSDLKDDKRNRSGRRRQSRVQTEDEFDPTHLPDVKKVKGKTTSNRRSSQTSRQHSTKTLPSVKNTRLSRRQSTQQKRSKSEDRQRKTSIVSFTLGR